MRIVRAFEMGEFVGIAEFEIVDYHIVAVDFPDSSRHSDSRRIQNGASFDADNS